MYRPLGSLRMVPKALVRATLPLVPVRSRHTVGTDPIREEGLSAAEQPDQGPYQGFRRLIFESG